MQAAGGRGTEGVVTDQNADPTQARAIEVLEANLGVLTGARPQRRRLVPGRAHVHRIALSWSGPDVAVCLQVLAHTGSVAPASGWTPIEAQAVAEACDLKGRGHRLKDSNNDPTSWAHSTSPRYHLVMLDAELNGDPAVLARRCAALEAGFLDGAGWMRVYSGGRFGEGTFTRVLERIRADVRTQVGVTEPPDTPLSRRHRGLC